MQTLAEFQRNFVKCIFQPGCTESLDLDVDPAGLQRVAIHRRNVFAALGNALMMTYPSVARLLGSARFREIAADFSVHFPPSGPVLYDFGGAFPDYLKLRDDLADHPALVDLASFDWHIDLTGHRPIDVFGPLIALSERVGLRFDSSLCCLSVSYEVDVLREALSALQGEDCVGYSAKAGEWYFLFWRAPEGVMAKRVSSSSYGFASRLLEGHSPGEALLDAVSGSTDRAPLAAIQEELLGTAFCQIVVPKSEGSYASA
jgi:hypothetical protein